GAGDRLGEPRLQHLEALGGVADDAVEALGRRQLGSDRLRRRFVARRLERVEAAAQRRGVEPLAGLGDRLGLLGHPPDLVDAGVDRPAQLVEALLERARSGGAAGLAEAVACGEGVLDEAPPRLA